jgi:hypothetical protein
MANDCSENCPIDDVKNKGPAEPLQHFGACHLQYDRGCNQERQIENGVCRLWWVISRLMVN